MTKNANTEAPLESLTVAQLRSLAKERNIPLKRGLRKAEIIAILVQAAPSLQKEKAAAPQARPTRVKQPAKARREPSQAPPAVRAYPPMPTELPEAYGHEAFALLVRDPWWLFAYWEIPEGRLWEGWGQLGVPAEETDLILRLYDVSNILFDGTNAHWAAEFSVYNRTGRWHLEANRPGATFLAELGLKTRDNRFLPLLRSNTVIAPWVGESPRLAAQWLRRLGREVTEIAPPAILKGLAVQPAARPAVSPAAPAEVGGPTSPPYR